MNWKWLVVTGLAGVSLVGCSKPTATESTTTTSEGQKFDGQTGKSAAKEGTALIRFLNADPLSEGQPGLQVASADGPVFAATAYKMITPYLQMPYGMVQLKLLRQGESKDAASARQLLTFGRHYTAVALPVRHQEKHDYKTSLVIMTDKLTELDAGRARVRLVNATSNVDDLDLVTADTKMRLQHGVDANAFTSFTDVDPGVLEIWPGKTLPPAALANLKVEADHLYTFVVVGSLAKLDLVRIEDKVGD